MPEFKYNQVAKARYQIALIARKLMKRKTVDLWGNRVSIVSQLVMAIDDAAKFYGITRDEFVNNVNKWPATEKRLFESASNLNDFYDSWNGLAAMENACANIVNQLIWFENYNICAAFSAGADFVIDFGCGTGALSLALALERRIKGELVLLDVPNDVSKFRQFRIDEHRLANVSQYDIFHYKAISAADLIICLDVLEHLENSSSVFINDVTPMLKVGGHIVLRAPWRGQLTHIDSAADDFYFNGGRRFLARNFQEVYRFGAFDVSCVYRKIRHQDGGS